MATDEFPTTLLAAVRYFEDEAVCRDFLASLRWPNGVVCIACGSDKVGFLRTRSLWRCRVCRKEFSVKKGTIFEDRSPLSPYALVAVSAAAAMARNVNNGIHTREARCIVVP